MDGAPESTVIKLQPFRQYQLLERVGSQQVLTGGSWRKAEGAIVLHKKRQRGYDPMPSRWIGVTEKNWRTYTVQGDSLVPTGDGVTLVRE